MGIKEPILGKGEDWSFPRTKRLPRGKGILVSWTPTKCLQWRGDSLEDLMVLIQEQRRLSGCRHSCLSTCDLLKHFTPWLNSSGLNVVIVIMCLRGRERGTARSATGSVPKCPLATPSWGRSQAELGAQSRWHERRQSLELSLLPPRICSSRKLEPGCVGIKPRGLR